MRRTGFDERRDQQIADDYTRDKGKCAFCGCMTDHDTLVEYGARCGPCFTQYVTGGRPNPPMPTRAEKKATLLKLKSLLALNAGSCLQWAEKLRNREQSGEALSLAQRQAWRAALGEEAAA